MKKSNLIDRLEWIKDSLERPLYRELEVGFRHGPLNPREQIDRYAETCFFAKVDLDYLIEELSNE